MEAAVPRHQPNLCRSPSRKTRVKVKVPVSDKKVVRVNAAHLLPADCAHEGCTRTRRVLHSRSPGSSAWWERGWRPGRSEFGYLQGATIV
jgi:hypothetical protein